MSLAQRVRDFRYSKGWGPDELAELRRDFSDGALSDRERQDGVAPSGHAPADCGGPRCADGRSPGPRGRTDREPAGLERVALPRRSPGLYDWMPSEGGPLAMPSVSNFRALSPLPSTSTADDLRFAIEPTPAARTNGHESIYVREGELMSKLHDLLHSSIGESVALLLKNST